jgi:glycosyltransferase involved in cell wall biosynthesis
MDFRYLFTVFTPTYNRAHTLHRAYESLKKQTFRGFEWLIVDDGSSDGTRELIERWQAEADFPIRYLYQTNQGKPAAYNHGVREAQGELFLFMDSDDACVPQALERFKHHWDGIPANEKGKFSAVTALCQDKDGRLVGEKFHRDILDSDSVEMYMRNRMHGEKWGFQRTDVLREFPFPTTPGVKFVPESVVWLALSRKYKTRFVNEVLRIYYSDDPTVEHLDALTANSLWGRAFFHKQVLNDFIDWLPRAPGGIFRSAVNFSRYSFDLGKGTVAQLRELTNFRARIFVLLVAPLGFLLHLKDLKRVVRQPAAA